MYRSNCGTVKRPSRGPACTEGPCRSGGSGLARVALRFARAPWRRPSPAAPRGRARPSPACCRRSSSPVVRSARTLKKLESRFASTGPTDPCWVYQPVMGPSMALLPAAPTAARRAGGAWLWNHLGWGGLSRIADEAANPRKTFSTLLAITVTLVTAIYRLSMLAGLAGGRKGRRGRSGTSRSWSTTWRPFRCGLAHDRRLVSAADLDAACWPRSRACDRGRIDVRARGSPRRGPGPGPEVK